MGAVLRANPQRSPIPAALGKVRGASPLWSRRESALYWVDIAAHQLHRFDPGHKLRDDWAFRESISAVAERASQTGLLLAVFDPEYVRLHQASWQPPLRC